LEGGFLRLGETVAVKSLMSCEEEEKRQQHQPQNRPQQQIQPEEVKTKTERSKSAFVLIVRQRQCLKERQRREETKEKKERKTMGNATTAFNLKSCWHSINPLNIQGGKETEHRQTNWFYTPTPLTHTHISEDSRLREDSLLREDNHALCNSSLSQALWVSTSLSVHVFAKNFFGKLITICLLFKHGICIPFKNKVCFSNESTQGSWKCIPYANAKKIKRLI